MAEVLGPSSPLHWRPALVLATLLCVGCSAPAPRTPKRGQPLDEARAVSLIAQAFRDEADTPASGRDIRLATGKVVHLDVASEGHKYGVAYLTRADMEGLDPQADLPPRQKDMLPIVVGTGEEASSVVLLLFAEDYEHDDLSRDHHATTSIVVEKRIARDVRDFLVQAHRRKLP